MKYFYHKASAILAVFIPLFISQLGFPKIALARPSISYSSQEAFINLDTCSSRLEEALRTSLGSLGSTQRLNFGDSTSVAGSNSDETLVITINCQAIDGRVIVGCVAVSNSYNDDYLSSITSSAVGSVARGN